MTFYVPLELLGVIYVVWLPLFWIIYLPLYRRVSAHRGTHVLLALVVQFIPPFGLAFLLIMLFFGLKQDREQAITRE